MGVTLVILAVSAVFFALGKVRSDIVALCALICLMLFGILTPQEALSGFSNSVVIMMIGLFVVGGAVFQTGLARMMGGKIMGMAGNSELRLFLLVMLVTAGIGAFVSNTGTVALMLPIVVSLAASAKMSASRLLMPLLRAISDAENLYYLANGKYTLDFNDLDISMPSGAKIAQSNVIEYEHFKCFFRGGLNASSPAADFSAYCNSLYDEMPQLEKYFTKRYFVCWANPSSSQSLRICHAITGTTEPELITSGRYGFLLQ